MKDTITLAKEIERLEKERQNNPEYQAKLAKWRSQGYKIELLFQDKKFN